MSSKKRQEPAQSENMYANRGEIEIGKCGGSELLLGGPGSTDAATATPPEGLARATSPQELPEPRKPDSDGRNRHLVVTWERLEKVERLMARGYRRREIELKLVTEDSLSRSQASRYVDAVVARWRSEGKQELTEETRQERRQAMRVMCLEGVKLAFERKAMSASGLEYHSPDVGAAQRMLDTLGRIDGLLEPIKITGTQVNVMGDMNVQQSVLVAMREAYGLAVADEAQKLPEGEDE